MKYVIITILWIFSSQLHAQIVNLVWAENIGGTNSVGIRSMCLDSSSNMYNIGLFAGTADFDPGLGVFNLASDGGSSIFIQKLNPSGNFIWAKKISGISGSGIGRDIIVDSSGNIFITGFFSGTLDFDPSSGIYNLTSLGGDDIFISKLNASGELIWAKNIGSSSSDWGLAISLDPTGGVYTTGYFAGTGDFDPGIGVYNLTSAGSNDIFISKLNADGNFVWATRMGNISNDNGLSIFVDGMGDVYTTGFFGGTVDFDPGPGIYNLTSTGIDIFISKLSTAGIFLWAKNIGGSASTNDWGESIVLDRSANIYVTGKFSGTADFDPGPGIFNLTGSSNQDIFICKLNSLGNFLWAKKMGGLTSSDFSDGVSISLDALGNVYTTGSFGGSVDFDPGAGIFNLTATGNFDVFISKLDQSGNFKFARKMGGSDSDDGRSIKVDTIGNLHVSGNFYSLSGNFDPGPGIYTLTKIGSGSYNPFFMKLSQSIWNGNISNEWNNPANWDSGLVPTKESDVFIPSSLTRYPSVLISTEIKSLTIKNMATVNVSPNINFKINN